MKLLKDLEALVNLCDEIAHQIAFIGGELDVVPSDPSSKLMQKCSKELVDLAGRYWELRGEE